MRCYGTPDTLNIRIVNLHSVESERQYSIIEQFIQYN